MRETRKYLNKLSMYMNWTKVFFGLIQRKILQHWSLNYSTRFLQIKLMKNTSNKIFYLCKKSRMHLYLQSFKSYHKKQRIRAESRALSMTLNFFSSLHCFIWLYDGIWLLQTCWGKEKNGLHKLYNNTPCTESTT